MSLATKIRGLREVWAFDNRLWLFVTKTLFLREKLHVYRYKGLEILVDHGSGDANGAREVLTSQMYTRFLGRMNLDGRINVLDIGASNGGFPLLLAATGIDIAKVVSVELNPRTWVRLQYNLLRNLECEAVVLNAAVTANSGVLNVSLGKGGVSDNIYSDWKGPENREYSVESVTLDDIYEENFSGQLVDICKIDVEGAEFEIFESAACKHLSKCRYLIMEIHERNGKNADQLITIIEDLGLKREETQSGADPNVHFFINKSLAAE